MSTRNICTTCALAFALGAANAVTLNGHSGATSSVTGLDTFVTRTTATFDQWNQNLRYEFTVDNGFSASQASIHVGAAIADYPNASFIIKARFQAIDTYQAGGIAFSTSSLGFTAGYGPQSAEGLAPSIAFQSSFANIGTFGSTYTISNLFFNGGSGLNPSSDSSCASFSCMVPFSTKGLLTIDVQVFAVPEPQSTTLTVFGLAAIGALARRRQSR